MLDFSLLKAVLFDMDGVLYRGEQPLPGVNQMLAFLEQHAIKYACITNNSGRTPQQVAAKVQGMGLAIPPDHIITSAMATNLYLRSVAPAGTKLYAVGMAGLQTELFGDGYFVPAEVEPRYVVVGVDFELTYSKLRTATLAIRGGATFIGTNPDRTYPAEDGIVPGAGSLLAAVEAATDQKPLIIGKPAPAMFETALVLLSAQANSTLMIGDRYDTDILGGARAGLRTAMVLTGVSGREEALQGPFVPDLIVNDLPALLNTWQAFINQQHN
jgi:4-nitrophenyl phosphatase